MSIVLLVLIMLFQGMLRAVADTIAHHYSTSVFQKWNRAFWDNSDAWWNDPEFKPAMRIFNYPVNGWHIANSIRIALVPLLCYIHPPLHWSLIYSVAVCVEVLTFNRCYNHLFKA